MYKGRYEREVLARSSDMSYSFLGEIPFAGSMTSRFGSHGEMKGIPKGKLLPYVAYARARKGRIQIAAREPLDKSVYCGQARSLRISSLRNTQGSRLRVSPRYECVYRGLARDPLHIHTRHMYIQTHTHIHTYIHIYSRLWVLIARR